MVNKKGLVRRPKNSAVEVIPTKVLSDGEEIIRDSDEDVKRKEIRERVGLTYERLCQTVRDGLVAEMAILDGEGNVVNRVPANSERAKFVAAAVDILGAKKADVGAQKIPSIIIVLPDGRRL